MYFAMVEGMKIGSVVDVVVVVVVGGCELYGVRCMMVMMMG